MTPVPAKPIYLSWVTVPMSDAVLDRGPAPADAETTLASRLAAAAERIFQHAPIGPDDDFFDLGCDSITALALALEAETITGRTVSPTTIYDAPTAALLAAHLAGPRPERKSRLVPLRPGDPALPPVFMAPGLGSTVIQLAELARALHAPNPVYGLEPVGLEGDAAPCTSIEDMAEIFAGDIARDWPGTTCHLLGYCYGGVIALELARHLAPLTGSRPPSLILVNSYPHSRFWPLWSRTRAWLALLGQVSPEAVLQRLRHEHLPALRNKPWPQAASHALRILGRGVTLPLRIFGLSAYVRENGADNSAVPADMPASVMRVQQAGAIAFRTHLPGRFGGPSLLIVSGKQRRLPFDPTEFWRRRLNRLTVHNLRCKSPDLLDAKLQDVAAIISNFILTQNATPPPP